MVWCCKKIFSRSTLFDRMERPMSAEAAKSTELPAPTREEVEKMIETFRTEGDPPATELYEIDLVRRKAEGKIQERADKVKKLLERMEGAKPPEPEPASANVLTLVQPTPTPAPAEELKPPTEEKKDEPAKPAAPKSHEKHVNACAKPTYPRGTGLQQRRWSRANVASASRQSSARGNSFATGRGTAQSRCIGAASTCWMKSWRGTSIPKARKRASTTCRRTGTTMRAMRWKAGYF
jgi:hypothetical protein